MTEPFCPCCGDDADADEEQARLMAQPTDPAAWLLEPDVPLEA